MALDKFQPYLFVSAGEQSNKYLTPTITNGVAQFQAQRTQSLTGLTVRIDPIQEGTGDPSPNNIRPISGRTGLTVTRTGKNLGELVEGTAVRQQYSTVTYTDGGVSVVSTATYGRIGFAIPVVIGQHYTVSFKCKRVGEPYAIQFNNVADFGYVYAVYGRSEMSTDSFSKKSFRFVANTDVLFVGVYPSDADTGIYIEEFQIETGDTATPYTPYVAPTTYPITWESIAGTVYGGTLDVVSGVLTVTHASYDLAALDWSTSSPSSHIFRGLYPSVNPPEQSDRAIAADAISSEYTVMAYNPISANDEGRFALGNGRFVIIDYRYSTTPDFVAHAADVQMVAKLATPTTYQLTPTQVQTIAGFNQIYSDAGPIIGIKF